MQKISSRNNWLIIIPLLSSLASVFPLYRHRNFHEYLVRLQAINNGKLSIAVPWRYNWNYVGNIKISLLARSEDGFYLLRVRSREVDEKTGRNFAASSVSRAALRLIGSGGNIGFIIVLRKIPGFPPKFHLRTGLQRRVISNYFLLLARKLLPDIMAACGGNSLPCRSYRYRRNGLEDFHSETRRTN